MILLESDNSFVGLKLAYGPNFLSFCKLADLCHNLNWVESWLSYKLIARSAKDMVVKAHFMC